MQAIHLREFVSKAYPYERTAAPFPPALRRAAWLSILSTVVATVVYPLLPAPEDIAGFGFFLVLGDTLASIVDAIQQVIAWLAAANGFGLVLAILLATLTRNFARGEALLHGLTCVPLVVGAGNALIVSAMSIIVVVNAAFWALLFGAALALFWEAVRRFSS